MGQLAVAVKKANKNENWRKEKMALLLGAERLDDARRAAVDESYRDELMREFGISQAE